MNDLLDAIRSLQARREIEHCGVHFEVDAFDFYGTCPQCGTRFKLRSFSGCAEIEDVFDAVFEWMNEPEAHDVVARRQRALEAEG